MIILGIADLGINLPVLVAQLVNFTILLVVLRAVAWGPLTKMLDERSERIRESLSAADQAKAQVAESERQVQDQVEAGRRDAQNLIARAQEISAASRPTLARRPRPTPTPCSRAPATRSASSATASSPTCARSSPA
jgi:F-type H+-transporting ATPase subunit b